MQAYYFLTSIQEIQGLYSTCCKNLSGNPISFPLLSFPRSVACEQGRAAPLCRAFALGCLTEKLDGGGEEVSSIAQAFLFLRKEVILHL